MEQKNFRVEIDQWQDVLLKKFSTLKRNDVGYGKAGVVLFLWYKFLSFGRKEDLDLCEAYLETVAEFLKDSMKAPSNFIFIELTEFGILLSIITPDVFKSLDVKELQAQIYEILSPYAEEFLKKGNLDPYTGGGYIYYYLRLIKKESSNPSFLAHLKRESIRKGNGRVIALEEGKKIQLGVTHGQAFIVLYLAELYRSWNKEDSRKLLQEFVTELSGQQQNFVEHGSYFSDLYDCPGNSKLSICYGDLGIIYSLYKGHELLYNKEGQKNIVQMLRDEFLRIERAFIESKHDLSLLYGLAGLVMACRIFQTIVPELNNDPAPDIFDNWYVKLLREELKGRVFSHTTPKTLSFSEGYTGSLICMMGNQIKDYSFARFFYFDS